MGNSSSSIGDLKPANFLGRSTPPHDGDIHSLGPRARPKTGDRRAVSESVPFEVLENLPSKDIGSKVDLHPGTWSNPLAPEISHVLKQNHSNDKTIDLESAILLLQHLKKTASPDDLIALRKWVLIQTRYINSNNL
jgi:hypothetical protein